MAKTSIPGLSQSSSFVLHNGKDAMPIKAGQANAFKAKAGEHYGNLKKKDAEEQLLDNVVAKPTGEDAKSVDAEGTGLTLESAFIQAPVEGDEGGNQAAIEAAMPGQLAQGYQPSAQGAAGASLSEGNNLGGQVFAYAGADALLLAQAETGIKPDVVASGAADPVVAAAGIGPLGVLGIVGLGVGVAAAAGGSSAPATVVPTVDTTAPTLSITSDVAAVKVGETATITFTFSEATSNFVVGDIATSNGSVSNFTAVSSTVYTATFTPTASLASGSASITVAGGNYDDAAGNSGGAGTTPTISIDTLAPVFSSGATANFAENGTGTAYDATADSDSGVTYTKSGTDASLFSINASTGLVTFAASPNYEAPADNDANNVYNLNVIATDAAGNATTQAVAITVTDVVESLAGQSVIDLGPNGKLILPVQVEGAWYYYWDRSGDGTSANTGALNGGFDYTTHNVLDGIFTSTLSEVNAGTTGTGTDTTDLIRYATLNGVKVALPTANGGEAYPQGINALQSGTSYTDAGVTTNGTTTSFNELLAIWDAYNGTGTGIGDNGTPSGWQATGYWSATPSASGHAGVGLDDGYVVNGNYSNVNYVALQVL